MRARLAKQVVFLFVGFGFVGGGVVLLCGFGVGWVFGGFCVFCGVNGVNVMVLFVFVWECPL